MGICYFFVNHERKLVVDPDAWEGFQVCSKRPYDSAEFCRAFMMLMVQTGGSWEIADDTSASPEYYLAACYRLVPEPTDDGGWYKFNLKQPTTPSTL